MNMPSEVLLYRIKASNLYYVLCWPDKVMSISLTKAVVIAFEEQRLLRWLMVLNFFCKADRQIEAERHNWMSQERCPCLIYWAGLPSWALWDDRRDGKERETRGSEAERRRGEEARQDGEQGGCWCWGEIWEEGMKGKRSRSGEGLEIGISEKGEGSRERRRWRGDGEWKERLKEQPGY